MSKARLAVLASVALAATLSPTAAAQPEFLATDDRGFIDTAARCEDPATAVAFGRTQGSLVAICLSDGQYEYRGVRLSDDALLTGAATETDDGGFSTENGGVTYTFTAKELVVSAGWRTIRTEPMVAYVEPRSATED
jgi:hypothetical protein